MTASMLKVLFICKGNSTLSIFGEAILKRLGKNKFQAFSAGKEPDAEIDALTQYQLQRNNYDDQDLQIDDWRDFAKPESGAMDFVIILSDDIPAETQPNWPGNPMIACWNIADPANIQGDELQRKSAFVRALTELESRISIFANLPIDSLDRLKLQQRLNEIGKK